MKLAALSLALVLASGSLFASETAQQRCDAYRLEMIQLNQSLEQKYGDRMNLLHDRNADPAARARLVSEYTVDPLSLRFRVLIEKFRPNPGFECNFWEKQFGPLAQ